MDFKSLVDGQCGEGNALMKLTQHVTKDQSFADEGFRFHDKGSHFKPDEFRGSISSTDLVEEFINETRAAKAIIPQTFRMDSLLQEMREIENNSYRTPPIRAPAIVDIASQSENWKEEFLLGETQAQSVGTNEWSYEFLNQQEIPQMNYPQITLQSNWTQEFFNNRLDFDKSQDLLEANTHQQNSKVNQISNELLDTLDDPKFAHSKFKKYIEDNLGDQRSKNGNMASGNTASSQNTWAEDFKKSMSQTQNEINNWEQQFQAQQSKSGDFLTFDREDLNSEQKKDIWNQLENEWAQMAEHSAEQHPWLTSSDIVEPFDKYVFDEKNELVDHPNPLDEGKKCLDEGNLPLAVLFFQAAAKQDPNSQEAWYLLGISHAQNEQDPYAIPALKKSIELQPGDLKTWMALATSYTNESYQNLACSSLKEWIKCNKEYSHLISSNNVSPPISSTSILSSTLASRETIDEVQNLYIKAANMRPTENIDADVQCGLGILFNICGEMEKAVDCFQSALVAKPNDAYLWNKLGATLANDNKSAEAVEAYRNALQISPGFIRCRCNLGIACINLGAYEEAMQHFLEALSIQYSTSSQNTPNVSEAISESIWATLRVCITKLNAFHLIPAVDSRNISKLTQEYGIRKT